MEAAAQLWQNFTNGQAKSKMREIKKRKRRRRSRKRRRSGRRSKNERSLRDKGEKRGRK